jgi:DNA replication protein DnaC
MANPTNHREKILQYLEILKMKMTGEQLDSFLQQHGKRTLSVSELLSKFLERPAGASQESAIQSRIKRAGFPTDATLESYDWTRNPKTIRREPFLELATGDFIRRKENAAFVGASGLGKTHLMQGVGRKCCALGYRVRYETSASLIEALNRARAVKALAPKVRRYCGFDLLVIDEFGFEKLERKEVPDALSLLYKVIDGRNRRSSTAIITNVSFDDWTEYLGDPPMTMALLDRVVDQTNVITFEGNSIRRPKKKSGK